MLKKFLKFIRGGENLIDSGFEGSYFEHLLREVRAPVLAELESCPKHDPILLVVVAILRRTMLNVWADELRKPLVDSQSFLTGQTGQESTITEEEQAKHIAAVKTPKAMKAIGADSEEPSLRDTAEIALEFGGGDHQEEQGQDDDTARPRVDEAAVLQAGREFLSLLVANDYQPIPLQLSVSETMLARELLLGFFCGDSMFETYARNLLEVIERKFHQGHYSQARILLSLFQTDETTRINNDRNLFYEDMIARLGTARKTRLGHEATKALAGLVESCREDSGISAVAEWVSEECGVVFVVRGLDRERCTEWMEVFAQSTRESLAEEFAQQLFPKSWRQLDPDLSLVDQVVEHVCADSLRDFVINHLKTCYFVLRAVGDTGLEAYLDSFFDWTARIFDVQSTSLMPELYQRSMSDPAPMDTILDDFFDRFYAEKAQAVLETLTPETIRAGCVKMFQQINDDTLEGVVTGHYDLGGMVLAGLLEVEYPSPVFLFRLHRMT
jgi:hypothetical protein